jgi:hypothetical protein
MQPVVNVYIAREAKFFLAFETLTQHPSRRIHHDTTSKALSEKLSIIIIIFTAVFFSLLLLFILVF